MTSCHNIFYFLWRFSVRHYYVENAPDGKELFRLFDENPSMSLPGLYKYYKDCAPADINHNLLEACNEADIMNTTLRDPIVFLNTYNLMEIEREIHRIEAVEYEEGSSADRRQAIQIAMAERQPILTALPAAARCLAQVLALFPRESTPDIFRAKNKNAQTTLSINGRVEHYTLQNDALFRNLPKLQADLNEVYVGKGFIDGTKQDVSTVINLNFGDESSISVEGERHLTSYDKAILNGVSSLMLANVSYFTLPMLYHAMTGVENPSLDPGTAAQLKSRLEFMRRTMVTIDVTNEIAAKFVKEDVEKAVYESYMLPLSRLQAVLNGREVEAYHLLSAPPLYQYAATKKQLSVVPSVLLEAPLNNTRTTIPLKNYILTRIQGMKNPHNKLKSNNILYKSIFAELGEENPTKLRRTRIREYTRQFLEHLLQNGYINYYEEYKEGRRIVGVTVDFDAKKSTPLIAPDPQESGRKKAQLKPLKPSEQTKKTVNRIGKPRA